MLGTPGCEGENLLTCSEYLEARWIVWEACDGGMRKETSFLSFPDFFFPLGLGLFFRISVLFSQDNFVLDFLNYSIWVNPS
jgi:hypothetical protein